MKRDKNNILNEFYNVGTLYTINIFWLWNYLYTYLLCLILITVQIIKET